MWASEKLEEKRRDEKFKSFHNTYVEMHFLGKYFSINTSPHSTGNQHFDITLTTQEEDFSLLMSDALEALVLIDLYVWETGR